MHPAKVQPWIAMACSGDLAASIMPAQKPRKSVRGIRVRSKRQGVSVAVVMFNLAFLVSCREGGWENGLLGGEPAIAHPAARKRLLFRSRQGDGRDIHANPFLSQPFQWGFSWRTALISINPGRTIAPWALHPGAIAMDHSWSA